MPLSPTDRELIALHTWLTSMGQRMVALRIHIGDRLFADWTPPEPRAKRSVDTPSPRPSPRSVLDLI